MENEDWLLDEIASGLQRLVVLSLERTPAAEVLAGTACAWVEALTAVRRWDEARDAPRLRVAFAVLGGSRTHWPAPRHLLEVLPDPAGQPRLAKPRPDPKVAQEAIDRIRNLLGAPVDVVKPVDEDPEARRARIAAAERELAERRERLAGKDAAANQGQDDA